MGYHWLPQRPQSILRELWYRTPVRGAGGADAPGRHLTSAGRGPFPERADLRAASQWLRAEAFAHEEELGFIPASCIRTAQ